MSTKHIVCQRAAAVFLALCVATMAQGQSANARSVGQTEEPLIKEAGISIRLSPAAASAWRAQLQQGESHDKSARAQLNAEQERPIRLAQLSQTYPPVLVYSQPKRKRVTGIFALFSRKQQQSARAVMPQTSYQSPITQPHRGQRRQVVASAVQRAPAYAAQSAAPQFQIRPQFLPTILPYEGPHKPGTLIIDTTQRYLYLVEKEGTARRYGVGVGRPGFEWAGTHKVTRKAEWPDWRPPAAMRKRQPELPAFMPGGPNNPLGARALYLGSTLYRIHGSNEPWTIGSAVSSGCIRMRNEDVMDLYNRVPVGAKVIVL